MLQLEYSLVERTAGRELLPMGAALGLGVMGSKRRCHRLARSEGVIPTTGSWTHKEVRDNFAVAQVEVNDAQVGQLDDASRTVLGGRMTCLQAKGSTSAWLTPEPAGSPDFGCDSDPVLEGWLG